MLSMEDFEMCLSIPHEGERICQGFSCDWKDYDKKNVTALALVSCLSLRSFQKELEIMG